MVSLWDSRLNGVHNLTPQLVANVIVPSDNDELEERLKLLFSGYIKRLMEGEMVKKLQRKKDEKSDEIAAISAKMNGRNRMSLNLFNELIQEKKVLLQERDVIVRRVREFKNAMRCLLKCIGCQSVEDECGEVGFGFELFRLEDERFDWGKIQALIFRECKRLEVGLPIYAHRQELLRRIYNKQVFYLFYVIFFVECLVVFLCYEWLVCVWCVCYNC